MKYIKEIPKDDKEFEEKLLNAGWKKLKEPKNHGTAFICSLPFMYLLLMLAALEYYFIYPPLHNILCGSEKFNITFSINIMTIFYIICLAVVLIAHELLHAVFIPNVWHDEKTYFGFNGLGAFVYSEALIKRTRFLLISVMPVIIISFIMPIILSVFGCLNNFVIFAGLLNCGGSCVDILNTCLILFQVPKNSDLVSRGHSTYYKSL